MKYNQPMKIFPTNSLCCCCVNIGAFHVKTSLSYKRSTRSLGLGGGEGWGASKCPSSLPRPWLHARWKCNRSRPVYLLNSRKNPPNPIIWTRDEANIRGRPKKKIWPKVRNVWLGGGGSRNRFGFSDFFLKKIKTSLKCLKCPKTCNKHIKIFWPL